MRNFPIGLIGLVVVSILIYFGVAHRVLDKLRMNDKSALAVIAAIIVGSFIDIPLGPRLTINVGGFIAVILAVYVWLGAGTAFEKIRSLIAAVVVGLALFIAGRYLGAEPEQIIYRSYLHLSSYSRCGRLPGRSFPSGSLFCSSDRGSFPRCYPIRIFNAQRG